MPADEGLFTTTELAPPSPPRRRAMVGRIKLGLLFGTCFLLATLGLGVAGRFVLPPGEIVELTTKLHPLIRQDDGFDTIAIGSSRMLRDFDPHSFDAAAKASGCPMHSYNLGLGDMNVIEMRYLLGQIAASRPPHLKRILFDPPNEIHVSFANLRSERMWVTTHPSAAPLALSDIWSHPDPRKLSATVRFVAAFAYRNSALGLLGRALHPEPRTDPPWPAAIDAAGYESQDPDAPAAATNENRALMLRTFDQFEAQLADLRRQNAGELPAAPISPGQETRRIDGILDLIALIRRMGYQPVVLHLPDTYGEAMTDAKRIEHALRVREPNVPDINLMNGAWAAEIYTPDAWFDRTHLNRNAAGRASAIVGADLCRQLGGD